MSDFDRLHSRRHDGEVQLLGFDLLELEGADLRHGEEEAQPRNRSVHARRTHTGPPLMQLEAAKILRRGPIRRAGVGDICPFVAEAIFTQFGLTRFMVWVDS